MKDDIEHFPLSIFQAALNTVVGGFIVMFVATDVGAWFGWYARTGELPTYWLSFVFLNAAPIFLSVIRGWGILYIAVLACLGFKLIYDDAPRLRYGSLIAVLHFLCTLWVTDDVVGLAEEENFGWRLLLSSLAFGALLLLLFLAVFIWRWRRYRPLPTPAKTEATTACDVQSSETEPSTTERE